ncbi:hypothetical protein [Pseudomonas lundensis]|uniref:hypothetical protein n=1 Tax=Pseudomonas lundensis TaxID=86185 RepID=UPI0014762755|nr:hypothetical protein [Pseudomonas lundensis]NNA01104.1 hypothetical protein [Pseudomonas lundensis]
MNTSRIIRIAKGLIEKEISTMKLFWLVPEIDNYCIDECFRLAQSDTRNPNLPVGIEKAPRWKQICADVCYIEFKDTLARIRSDRLAAR